MELKNIKNVYVHKISADSTKFKKSFWGDYYTDKKINVEEIVTINDGLDYLENKGWNIRIKLK